MKEKNVGPYWILRLQWQAICRDFVFVNVICLYNVYINFNILFRLSTFLLCLHKNRLIFYSRYSNCFQFNIQNYFGAHFTTILRCWRSIERENEVYVHCSRIINCRCRNKLNTIDKHSKTTQHTHINYFILHGVSEHGLLILCLLYFTINVY